MRIRFRQFSLPLPPSKRRPAPPKVGLQANVRVAWHLLPCSAVIELLAVTLFAANLALTLLQPPAHLRSTVAIS